ncbi:MAG: hypothetical protein AAGE65_15335 [Planctomycetota bacterium]
MPVRRPTPVTLALTFALAGGSVAINGCDPQDTPPEPSPARTAEAFDASSHDADPAPALPPWNEATYTREVLPPERRAAFYRRSIVDLHRRHADLDRPEAKTVERFLQDACHFLAYTDFSFYHRPPHVTSRRSLQRRLHRLRQQATTTPLIEYVGQLCQGIRHVDDRDAVIERQTAFRAWAEDVGETDAYTAAVLALDHAVMRATQKLPDFNKRWVRSWANGNAGPAVALLTPKYDLTPADELEYARLFEFYAEGLDADTADLLLQATDAKPSFLCWNRSRKFPATRRRQL